jgi:DNA polymerase-1
MTTKKPTKLMIIDGHALIHRSFHALPTTLTTKDGVIVNAVYGFTSFLLKAFLEFKPEYVALTLDRKAPTFRHEEYADYKGTRTAAPDELYEQVPIVKEVAEALDIPIFELDGFEADDLIGTITKRAEEETNFESYIVTGDMDSLQLVSKRTKVYSMSRGLNDSTTYDEAQVELRYGLKPNQIVDYKALRGDVSDNIPGVKGIGEKTATELLQNFKTLDGVYQAVKNEDEKIKPRIRELLKTYQEDAYLSQRLATIKRDVTIDLNWEDLKLDSFDVQKASDLFIKLEFKSLIAKLKLIKGETTTEEITEKKYTDKFERNRLEKNYQLIQDDQSFENFFKKIKAEKEFAFDTETSGLDPITAELLGLSFSWEKNSAYYLDLSQGKKQTNTDLFSYQKATEKVNPWLIKLKDILENAEIKKCAHNAKFDVRVLKNQGINLKGLVFDSMLASYLLNPDNRQHGLDVVSFRELSWEKISTEEIIGKGKNQISFAQADSEKIAQYAGEDADCAWLLKNVLEKKIKKENLEKLLIEIELPLVEVLAEMEENGIILEPKALAKIEIDLASRLKELAHKIYELAGEEFNINSPKQLQVILFERLSISSKNIKKTKTGISTADDELEKLLEEHEIISLIQDYRELNKLQSTYVLSLPELINKKTGRIHTSYNQTVAATGRLSSTEPNLQNIPTRTEEGQKIRSAFVAAKGYKLVGLDYSQIELRLAAHLSGDKKMIKAFKEKEDIHRATAAEINDVSKEDVTKKMRYEAKAINFGILYGQGPHGLSQSAKIPYKDAQEFIAKYFASYPEIRKMIDSSISLATEKGYAETMFGRKRYLPEINSSNVMIRKSAERMAINTPIQGTAADLIKIAMIHIFNLIKENHEEIKLLLQIHDELIFEIKEDKIDYWLPKIKDLMEKAINLKVQIIVEAAIGDNWGELK